MTPDPRIAAAALEGLRDGVLVISDVEVVVANGAAARFAGAPLLGEALSWWSAVA